MSKREHWEHIYTTKDSTRVSWFRTHLDLSLLIVDSIGLDANAGIIDVGCGTSTFVQDLHDRGYRNLTCVDISAAAIKPTIERLGERIADVR